MYRVPVEPTLHTLIEQLSQAVPGSECASDIKSFLHDSLDKSSSFSEWTARILARLFRNTPLVIFESHLAEARRLAVSLMQKAIQAPLVAAEAANDAGKRLHALGYPWQVKKADNEACFCLEVAGKRRKVLFADEQCLLPEEQQTYTTAALSELLEQEPERFSPNALFRPVIQQYLFPATLAYVAGPGELAYWAQLKAVFAHFEQPEPVVYPRARAILIPPKEKQWLSRYHFSCDDLLLPAETLLDRALRVETGNVDFPDITSYREQVDACLSRLQEELTPGTPPWDMTRRLREGLRNRMERIDRVLRHQDQQQAAAVRKRIKRLQTVLLPGRHPQERVLNIFSFLFEQGWELVPRITSALDIERFSMNTILL